MAMKQRQNHVFKLVQPHLKTKGLPVDDLENINCWENVHYSLLCLDDESFEMVIKNQLNQEEEIKVEKIVKVEDMIIDNKSPEKGQQIDTGDRYLNEIEKALAKGDMKTIDTLLKNLK